MSDSPKKTITEDELKVPTWKDDSDGEQRPQQDRQRAERDRYDTTRSPEQHPAGGNAEEMRRAAAAGNEAAETQTLGGLQEPPNTGGVQRPHSARVQPQTPHSLRVRAERLAVGLSSIVSRIGSIPIFSIVLILSVQF